MGVSESHAAPDASGSNVQGMNGNQRWGEKETEREGEIERERERERESQAKAPKAVAEPKSAATVASSGHLDLVSEVVATLVSFGPRLVRYGCPDFDYTNDLMPGNADPFLDVFTKSFREHYGSEQDSSYAFREYRGDDSVRLVFMKNISPFRVIVGGGHAGGLLVREGQSSLDSYLLDPGEITMLACFATKDPSPYDPGEIPHLRCHGFSRKDLASWIAPMCVPAVGRKVMVEGLLQAEMWRIHLEEDHPTTTSQSPFPMQNLYLKISRLRCARFADARRPLPLVQVPFQQIHSSQEFSGNCFRDGTPLAKTVKALQEEDVAVADLAIRVLDVGGVFFALDNRRLKCVRLAFPEKKHPTLILLVLLADLADPAVKEEWSTKFNAGPTDYANKNRSPHNSSTSKQFIDVPLGDVRYCQDSCGKTFRDGSSLATTVQALQENRTTIADLSIRVVQFGGTYFALDNRRLRCVKTAFPELQYSDSRVPVLLADLADTKVKQEWDMKFTAGQTIVLRGDEKQRQQESREKTG
ncbi:unnamed protein product [Polarella glacialis]|uniref:Uncharacterized protein n=1 Tax=Polarella glacialis TaxID=89957 RepID=A0A813HQ20_POLGL|nr:unnamed protein product [Polarella glacialis]